MGSSKSSHIREVYSNTSLPQEQGKSQLKNITLYLKQLDKEQTKLKVSRRREIINIRAEINETETKKIEKNKKTKSCYFENTESLH